MGLLGGGDHRGDDLVARGVAGDGDRVETLGRRDHARLVEVGDDDVRTRVDEGLGDGGTDAAGGAGDDRDLVLDLHRSAHQSHGPPAT